MRAQLLAIALVVGLLLPTSAAAHTESGVMSGVMTFSPALSPLLSPASGTWSLDATAIGLTSTPIKIAGDFGPLAGVVGASCGSAQGANGAGVLGHHTLADAGFLWTGPVMVMTANTDNGVFHAELHAVCLAGPVVTVFGTYSMT